MDTIKLEGAKTPDIVLNEDEEVLLDVSQGIRDLGLISRLMGHKGRLILTTRRVVNFTKKTRDYEIEQMNIKHAGYLKLGFNFKVITFAIGLFLSISGLYGFTDGTEGTTVGGLILLLIGLYTMFSSRVKSLKISGSDSAILFATTSISEKDMAKVITVLSHNS